MIPLRSPLIASAGVLLLAGCGDSTTNSASEESSASTLVGFPTLNQSKYNPETGDLTFPEMLASLDGTQVSIAGFMAPYDELDDMSRFMLMPSYVGCHFCKPPALNQVLYVEQRAAARGNPPQFIHEPIMITGTLRLFHPESEHPGHLAEFVYALDGASIEVLDEEALKKAKAVHTTSGKQNPQHGPPTKEVSSNKEDQ